MLRYQESEDLWDGAMLQRVSGLMVKITREMRREQEWTADAAKGTRLDRLVSNYKVEYDMTNIEVMQTLHQLGLGILKYMLRYERHGNYDKPAGFE